jgi:hypothetical protein
MADDSDQLTVQLTENERQMLIQVLKEFDYSVHGVAIIRVGEMVKGLLFKLKDKET